MSTELSLFDSDSQLPAHLQQYKKHAEDAAGLVTGFNSLPKISLRGKQFRYMIDDKEFVYPMGAPFICVIIAIDPPNGVAKSWYKDAYDSDTAELPDCFSADGVKPDALSGKVQARSCAECPKNAFGSGTDSNGRASKGKACSDFKNLFVVEHDKLGEQVSVLRVPATSLKNLSAYGRKLNKGGVAPQVIVTEMTFTDAEYPQLEFKAIRYLDEVEAAQTIARCESDEVQMALPSQNIIGSFDPGTGEILDTPLIEAPAGKTKIVMTDKADGMTFESFIEAGWTEPQLLADGYAEKVEVEKQAAPTPPEKKAPAAPKPEPKKVLTAKAIATETTYDEFIANGWTDDTLIEHGYMEIK